MVAAFGPYVAEGVRTEQVAVYGSVVVAVVAGWPVLLTRGLRGIGPVVAIWAALCFVAFLGVAAPSNTTPYPSGSVLAGVDNLVLPMCVVGLAAMCAAIGADSRALVVVVARLVVLGMSVNALVSIVSVASGQLDPFGVLRVFWNDGSEVSVADLAATNGRYTGVFNHPAEAGVMYSLAVFLLLFLAHLSGRPRTAVTVGTGTLLTIGGVLTVSKMFLLGGLPIVAVLVLRDRGRRLRLATAGASVAAGWLLLSSTAVVPAWDGSRMLRQLLDPENAGVSTLTAGRLGEGGTLLAVAEEVLTAHAWTGVGAGGLRVPYDSVWIEAMVVAGVSGLVCVVAVIAHLVHRLVSLRGALPRPEWTLAAAVVLLAAGASLGLPVLTANRVATVLWLLLSLLLLSPPVTSRQPDDLTPIASRADDARRHRASSHGRVPRAPAPPGPDVVGGAVR